eukprot:Skav213257  [mRNA]  locus=scaffold1311:167701:170460:+ [translate_table: standard]
MSAPYLLYTKYRFNDLKEWQSRVFPPSLSGGIAKRQPSDIAHKIAAKVEMAVIQKNDLIGFKLDRSKCFDRICPHLICELGKTLGLPQPFINVWSQVYQDFRRLLTVGQFIDPTPIPSSNGVAQGDSASVLAINILMTGWAAVISSIPHVDHYAFIDDAYLMASGQHFDHLCSALDATKLYDALVGQKFNLSKSEAWATTKRAKTKLAERVPDVPIVDAFQVLGTFVKTTAKSKTIDACSTATFIRNVIHDIGALPISMQKKSFLISVKAISKLLYHPEIKPWPKMMIDKLASTVAAALWGNRPHWRSIHLLFACFTCPALCHPALAIATRVIMHVISQLRKDTIFFQMWIDLCNLQKIIPRGLLDAFFKACEVLGFLFQPPFHVKFLGRIVGFLNLQPKTLARMCRLASTQSLFSDFLQSGRDDVCVGGSSFLDNELAPPGDPREPWRAAEWDGNILPSPLTGCLPTANRLYQAGLLEESKCRFCEHHHEDIQHLAMHCPGTQAILGSPGQLFQDQPLFYTHGLFQVPQYLLDCISAAEERPSVTALRSEETQDIWLTTGISNPQHVFSRTIGWDLYNLSTGDHVQHAWCDPFGNRTKAAIYGFLQAALQWNGRLRVCTDSKLVVDVWNSFIRDGRIPPGVAFQNIWSELQEQRAQRDIQVVLCRASQLPWDIVRDLSAKGRDRCGDALKTHQPVAHAQLNAWRMHVDLQRAWLCRLSTLLSEQKPCEETNEPNPELATDLNEHILNNYEERFPRWDWHLSAADFPWQMQTVLECPDDWLFSQDIWRCSKKFWADLRWRVAPDARTSIAEIAILFWVRTRTMPPNVDDAACASFNTLMKWIRWWCFAYKTPKTLFPMECDFWPRRMLRMNQAFGYGSFEGARPFVEASELRLLADFVLSLPGHGQRAKDWDVGVSCLP